MANRRTTRWHLVLAALLTACLTPHVNAQGVDRGRVYTKAEVAEIIRHAENASDTFRAAVDTRLDRSRLNGTEREDFMNRQVKQLENRLDELRARFDRTDTWLETREEVRHVLVAARDVAGGMRRGPFGRPLAVEWRRLRADLNTLAGVYDLPKL